MEELAKLEAERGTPRYAADGIATSGYVEAVGGHGAKSVADGLGGADRRKGKRERESGRNHCACDCGAGGVL